MNQESAQSPAPDLERRWTLQLYQELREILRYYKIALDVPVIQLSDSRTRYGSFDALGSCLMISIHLIREHSWDAVIEILKHELAHMLAGEASGQSPHGAAFQQACDRLGVAPWARHAMIEIDPATAVQQHRQLDAEQERLLRRVEKLLSLAASDQTHEATLAMERAREIIARHQLEQATAHKPNFTYVLIQHGKKVTPAHQSSISSILCTHFYVDCVHRSLYDASLDSQFKVLEILGTRENVQMAEYVYWFLWNQLPLMWQHWRQESSRRPAPSGRTRTSQRSFYLGVLNGFHEKLSQQKRAMSERSTAWGLVPAESQRLERRLASELRAFVHQRFPHLHSSKGHRRGIAFEAYTGGQERGRELNLHRGLTHAHEGVIQLLHSGKG